MPIQAHLRQYSSMRAQEVTCKSIASFSIITHGRPSFQQALRQHSQHRIIHGTSKLDMLQIRHAFHPQEPRGIPLVLLDEQAPQAADASNLLQLLITNTRQIQPTMDRQSIEEPEVARILYVLYHQVPHAGHLPGHLHRRFLVLGRYMELQNKAVSGVPRFWNLVAKAHIPHLPLCLEP